MPIGVTIVQIDVLSFNRISAMHLLYGATNDVHGTNTDGKVHFRIYCYQDGQMCGLQLE